MSQYRIFIQRAHHDNADGEEYLCSTTVEVLAVFDSIGWLQEHAKAKKLLLTDPTFIVENADRSSLLCVSAIGLAGAMEFTSEYRYPADTSRLFGLWKGAGQHALSTHALYQLPLYQWRHPVLQVENRTLTEPKGFTFVQARQAVALFLAGNHPDLVALHNASWNP